MRIHIPSFGKESSNTRRCPPCGFSSSPEPPRKPRMSVPIIAPTSRRKDSKTLRKSCTFPCAAAVRAGRWRARTSGNSRKLPCKPERNSPRTAFWTAQKAGAMRSRSRSRRTRPEQTLILTLAQSARRERASKPWAGARRVRGPCRSFFHSRASAS